MVFHGTGQAPSPLPRLSEHPPMASALSRAARRRRLSRGAGAVRVRGGYAGHPPPKPGLGAKRVGAGTGWRHADPREPPAALPASPGRPPAARGPREQRRGRRAGRALQDGGRRGLGPPPARPAPARPARALPPPHLPGLGLPERTVGAPEPPRAARRWRG